jgi:hypothetical protein
LRDTELETSENINKLSYKDKYLKKQFQKYRNGIISVIPLERLYAIHRDIISYHEKYKDFGDKINEILSISLTEEFYTGVQYLNRVVSVANGVLLLTENLDTQQGGTFTIVSSGVELILSYSKDKLFNVEEKKKTVTEFVKDTENFHHSIRELARIFRSIHISSSLGKLSNTLNNLKKDLKKKVIVGESLEDNELVSLENDLKN